MSAETDGKPLAERVGVKRLLFRKIVPGDRRKFVAESNDSATGGGARDLRFRPEGAFIKFFSRMFPGRVNKNTTRNGEPTVLEIITGQIRWKAVPWSERQLRGKKAFPEKSGDVEIWPATGARPNECRLAKVHNYDFLPMIPPDDESERPVMLMIMTADDSVWISFVTETSIKKGNWHHEIKPVLLDWLKSGRLAGYFDLELGEVFHTDPEGRRGASAGRIDEPGAQGAES